VRAAELKKISFRYQVEDLYHHIQHHRLKM